MNFNKVIILKLNTSWQPIGFGSVQKIIPDMVAGSAVGLHLSFDMGENGEYNYDSPIESYPVEWGAWIDLPIRDYDEYIQTVNRKIRVPRIVITSHNGMPMIQPKLTSQAVMERDGYTCFVKGTIINTPDGLIPIERLQKGQLIYDGSWNLQRIPETRASHQNVHRIDVHGERSMFATKDHKFPCITRHQLNHRDLGKDRVSINWSRSPQLTKEDVKDRPVSDLGREHLLLQSIRTLPIKSDRTLDVWDCVKSNCCYTKRKDGRIANYHKQVIPSKLRFSCDDFYALGLWLAEGSFTDRGVVQFSFHINEADYILAAKRFLEKFSSGKVTTNVRRANNTTNVYTCCKWLSLVLEFLMGRHSQHKAINLEWFYSHTDIKSVKRFILGYCNGDGYNVPNVNRITTSSRSERLTLGVQQLSYSCGMLPTQPQPSRSPSASGMCYSLSFSGYDYFAVLGTRCDNVRVSTKRGFIHIDGASFVASPIKRISDAGIARVFDIEVTNTHTYIVNNTVTHNCQYTGKKFTRKNAHKHLNIDHVVPRASGGKTIWENLVTACRDVNTAKDCKPLEKTGLKLTRAPQKPRARPVVAQLHQLTPAEIEPQWKWLIGGNIETT